MTESQRIPLPSGLPKQFSDGRSGYQRLHKFLEIPNTKAVEAVLAAVKDAVQHVPVAKLQGADRRRVLLLAFYEKPDSRRRLWQQALDDRLPTAYQQPVPSLEFIALQRHDTEFREREVDTAAVQDALRDFPDLLELVADAPDWQRPVLAAWPALQRDIADWNALSDDRRDATALALFAVATVLDDHRFLRWATRGVESLREEFSPLFNDHPEDAPPDDGHDVIRQWKEICNTIATTARTLGADPPRPELLPDLLRYVDELAHLRGSLTSLLNSAVPEQLLQRLHDILARLLEDGDSPISAWKDRIGEQWRSVYIPNSPDTSSDIQSLRADVERLEAELESALDAWRAARSHRASLNEQHQEIKRQAEADDDPLKRLDAQDREPQLAQELYPAAAAVQSARDRVFLVVAPKDQKFDPRRDYLGDEASTHSESFGVQPAPRPRSDTQASTENDAERAIQDAGEPASPTSTEPDQDATPEVDEAPAPATGTPAQPAGPPADTPFTDTRPPDPSADPSPALDRRPTSAIEGLWHALAAGRPGIAYHIARLCAEHGYANVPPPLADVIAASMLAPAVHSPDSEPVRDLRPILERIDPAALLRDERPQPERDPVSLLLFSATMRPALFAPTTGAPSLLRAVSLSDTLKPVYDLATRVADHADRLLGVRLHASMFRSSETGTWQDRFDALTKRVRAWRVGADSKQNLYGPATTVWRDLFGRDGVLEKLVRLISDSDKSVRPNVEAIHEQISDQRTFNELVHRADQRGRKRNPIVGRALKQMWNDVQPAVQLSGQWLSLMDIRPDTAGFINQRVDALHNDLKRVGRKAIETLDGAANTAAAGDALAATSTYARNAINELLQSFDRDAAFTESSLEANVLRSRDLLYVKDVDIDAGFDPVSTEETRLLDRLLNTAAHADTMRGAFHDRLERSDFIGARLALDLLETEDGVDVDECIASFVHRINDRRKTLRTELRSTQKRLESAFCRGQLPVDDRDATAAALATLRQAAEPSSIEPPRIEAVEVLTESSRRLNEINDAIKASSRSSIERVRSRLQHVPDHQMDEAARGIVDRTIEEGYVQTAHEQINRLECGESVEPPPPVDDPFSKFTSVVDAIETARKTTEPRTIVGCARARERVATVPFDELAEEDAQSAACLLDAWYQTARKRSVDKTRLWDLASAPADRTLAPGGGVVAIGLAGAFSDPDDDTLTYTAWSSDAVEDAARAARIRDIDRGHADRILRGLVAEDTAGRRDRQPFPRVGEPQIAVFGAGVLDDDEAGAHAVGGAWASDRLDGILRAVLRIRRAGEHVVVRVDQEQVVIVRRPADRIGPLQDDGAGAVLRDLVAGHAAAEVVVGGAGAGAGQVQRRSRGEVAFPDAGRAVVQVPVVGGRRHVVTAVGGHGADRPGDDAVLERRRQPIADVVDDDVGAGRAEILDVLRHLRPPADAGGEKQVGARRQIVDDLQHGGSLGSRAFVGTTAGRSKRAARLSGQDRDLRRHVARRLLLGERVDAVREHADARAVHAVGLARHVRLVGHIALGGIDLTRRVHCPRDG